MRPNRQETEESTLTEEILNGKLRFLCSGISKSLGISKSFSNISSMHQGTVMRRLFYSSKSKENHSRILCMILTTMMSRLTLSRRRPLSYRNESIDLQSKSKDWFIYENGPRHERVN